MCDILCPYFCYAGSSNKKMKAVIVSTVVAGILLVVGCAYVFWMFLARHRGNVLNYAVVFEEKCH